MIEVCEVDGLFPLVLPDIMPKLPSLERFLANCRWQPLAPYMKFQWPLLREQVSLAEQQAKGLGIQQDFPHWLRADPMHFRAEGDGVLLMDSYTFSLSESEASQLIDSLNRHCENDGIRFYKIRATEWLVGFSRALPEGLIPPWYRVGRTVDGYLPSGSDQKFWVALFNEIQMILFSHPLNETRTTPPHRAINGVWFWDKGFWSSEATTYDGLRSPAAYGDEEGWLSAIRHFDSHWLAPRLRQLKQEGRKGSITLVVTEGPHQGQLTLNSWDLFKFWRRAQGLARWLSEKK